MVRVHKIDLFVGGKKINIRKIVNFIEGDQAGQSRVKQDLAARGGQNTKEMQVK